MTEFCVTPDFMLDLLDEVSRTRALKPHETDMIEDILAMETTPFKWNPRLENQLLVAAHSPGGIVRFARRHGIEHTHIAYQKLYRLRRRQSQKKKA